MERVERNRKPSGKIREWMLEEDSEDNVVWPRKWNWAEEKERSAIGGGGGEKRASGDGTGICCASQITDYVSRLLIDGLPQEEGTWQNQKTPGE